ncbi:MAG: pseudouridine synthase [Pseudomonadota bacterium]
MTEPHTKAPANGERIAKRLARAGVCSRREAERLIEARRVAVDGVVLDSPALNVTPNQLITVDGAPIPDAEPTRLWRFHKPAGLVTTHRDPEGRPTVFDQLPEDMPRVISIGRLDLNSEGLLLLTNDGALARHLELPQTGWVRRYRVRAFGSVTEAKLEALLAGVEVDGMTFRAESASLDRSTRANSWLTLGLREGKNREVRRMLEAVDLTVTRLIRVAYGPFQLGQLKRGAVEEVKGKVLAEQVGKGRLGPRRPRRTDKKQSGTQQKGRP